MITLIHYLVTKDTIRQITPFPLKVEYNFLLTKGGIYQKALLH